MHQEKKKAMATKKEHKTIDQILDLSETVDNDLYKQFEDLENLNESGGAGNQSESDSEKALDRQDEDTKILMSKESEEIEEPRAWRNDKIERSRIPIYVRSLLRLEILGKYYGLPRTEMLSRLIDLHYDKIKDKLNGRFI